MFSFTVLWSPLAKYPLVWFDCKNWESTVNLFFLFSFFFYISLDFSGKSAAWPGKTTVAAWAVLPKHTSACWYFFSSFRDPQNTDMDYRTLNVLTWSFLCVYIHTGVGHTDTKSAQPFWLGKTHTFFLCFWRDWNSIGSLMSWNLESDTLSMQPPRHTLLYVGFTRGGTFEPTSWQSMTHSPFNPAPIPPPPSPTTHTPIARRQLMLLRISLNAML